MKSEHKVKVSHTLSKPVYDLLGKMAEETGYNRSRLIEVIIREWIELKKEKKERETYDRQ